MQPMSGTSKAADLLITNRDGDRTHDPLNSEAFWRKKVDDVRDDEVFFHTYFEKAGKAKQADKKAKKKSKKDADSDDESGEDEIWKALVKSRPDVEGDGGDDDFDDIDMDDMWSDSDAEGGVTMDDGVELNLGSDDEGDAPAPAADDDDDDDFENFDLDEEDAFMDDEDDIPVDISGLVEGEGDEDTKDGRKKKKRKLKQLPTFASADDYAKLIGDDSE
jgi:ribosome biogenesis protein MAK21